MLVDQIHDIFKSMRGIFIATAVQYKVPNPTVFVDGWLSSAFIIAEKFDNGTLDKKIADEEGNLVECKDDDIAFLKSFKGYLKTSFRNEIYKAYGKTSKEQSLDATAATPKGQAQMPTVMSYETYDDALLNSACIEHILVLVNKDLERSRKLENSISDKINTTFLECLADTLKTLEATWSGLPVILDVTSTNHVTYFDADFRKMLPMMLSKRLALRAMDEKNPMIFDRLGKLVISNLDSAIQKRLFRYFFEYYGGLNKRLTSIIKTDE